jgi:3-hydroxybutyryl-CoA dehydratase
LILALAKGDTLAETIVGPFDAADVAAYAQASGDDNPLHTNPALAEAAGFAAPPVHGMCLMAAIEPALHAWRPDHCLKRLAGTFAEPLLIGEVARLTARVLRAGPEILVRVNIQGPRRGPCVVAEAVLVAKQAGPSR